METPPRKSIDEPRSPLSSRYGPALRSPAGAALGDPAVPQPIVLGAALPPHAGAPGYSAGHHGDGAQLARIIYHLITHRVAYDDRILAAAERQDMCRFERRLRRQARALGYELVPEAA